MTVCDGPARQFGPQILWALDLAIQIGFSTAKEFCEHVHKQISCPIVLSAMAEKLILTYRPPPPMAVHNPFWGASYGYAYAAEQQPQQQSPNGEHQRRPPEGKKRELIETMVNRTHAM